MTFHDLIETKYNLYGLAFAAMSTIIDLLTNIDNLGSTIGILISAGLGGVSFYKSIIKVKHLKKMQRLKEQVLQQQLLEGTLTLEEINKAIYSKE